MRRLLLNFFIIFVFSNCYAATTNEEICLFETQLFINQNASLNVVESITVNANEKALRHGIVRWLPTNYIDQYGVKHLVTYHVKKVLLNDKPIPYSTILNRDGLTLKVGDRTAILSSGMYRFSLEYEAENALDFLQNRDSLQWNVTGQHWDIPISEVKVTLHLPPNVPINQFNGLTGNFTNPSKNFKVSRARPNVIEFTTTQPLTRKQSLQVEINWPKGYIKKLTPILSQTIPHFVPQIAANELNLAIGLTMLLVVYYLLLQFLYVKPRFFSPIPFINQPPAGLSPAAMRFIEHTHCDYKTLLAGLHNMMAKNYIRLDKKNERLVKNKFFDSPQSPSLSEDEKELAAALFKNGDTIPYPKKDNHHVRKAVQHLKIFFQNRYENVLYLKNGLRILPGCVLGLVTFFILFNSLRTDPAAQNALIILSLEGAVAFFLLIAARIYIQTAFWLPSFKSYFLAILTVILSLSYIWLGLKLVDSLTPHLSTLVSLLGLVTVFITLSFLYLLKIPTPFGAKLWKQIQGFKGFLASNSSHSSLKNNVYDAHIVALGLEEKKGKKNQKTICL